MKNYYFRIVVFTLFAIGTFAQIPSMRADGPSVQDPCATAQTEHDRAVKAEHELSAVRLELTTCMSRHTEELGKANRATVDAERELAGMRKLSTALAGSYQESQQKVTTLEQAGTEKDATIATRNKTIVTVTAERDAAQAKIKAANGRWFCDTFPFPIGCIGKK